MSDLDVFRRHGLKNLSPSAINSWTRSPSLYLLGVSGVKEKVGAPAIWRGSAVDKAVGESVLPTYKIEKGVYVEEKPQDKDGVVITTEKKSKEELMDFALQEFDRGVESAVQKGLFIDSKKLAKERENVPRYLENALLFYDQMKAVPRAKQVKVECYLGDIPVPFRGYIDLLYDNAIRDTKTVGRQESSLSFQNARQIAFYKICMDTDDHQYDAYVDTVGVNNVNPHKLDDMNFWIDQIYTAAKSLEKMLSLSDDIYEVMKHTFPDTDQWYWGEETRKAAKEIWTSLER